MVRTKSDEYRFKVITDPVHSEISLSQLEVALIDTPSFQRLRRLKQLGLASYVYPGATHTRFAHSLGVFHVISRAIDAMVRRNIFSEPERRKLRVAALLHDVGHYPYSHLVEFLDRDPDRAALLARGRRAKARIPYPDHETLGELVITKREDIARELRGAKIDPTEIARIVRGGHNKQKYNQLVHSTLDADRLDYLARDAIGTGVPFGRVDVPYLLGNLEVDKNDRLALRAKAATAAEHFVLARYFMFKAVYQHKTVFGFEAMMRQALTLLRAKGKLWRDGSVVEGTVSDPTEFLAFHDGWIDKVIGDHVGIGGPLGRLCQALRDRRAPELIAEVSSLAANGTSQAAELTRFHARRKDHIQAVAKKCGIPLECWLWEDPKQISFEKLGPFVDLDEASSVDQTDVAELLYILDERGRAQPLIQDRRSILHYLSRLRFKTARLYVVEDDPHRVLNAKLEVDAWIKP